MSPHRVQIVEQRSGDWYLREKYGNNEVGRKSEGYASLSGAKHAAKRDFADLPTEVIPLPTQPQPPFHPPPESGAGQGDPGDESNRA